ncbi:uncharacterized protein Tco025E_00064 [Trypanosoma conorhini]|uniref:Uncharacterized protein n=1 Tax=Trypanosoma conorhini TaxID=83891 RepID=A0A3R7N9I8_9TRYP|nr:uncharacterized protein Tco025E_00064 [Trypanosoma conorhini]RNF27680.1 hypothetical protein Tco025E_00064 [Trypanosoma conorhini]
MQKCVDVLQHSLLLRANAALTARRLEQLWPRLRQHNPVAVGSMQAAERLLLGHQEVQVDEGNEVAPHLEVLLARLDLNQLGRGDIPRLLRESLVVLRLRRRNLHNVHVHRLKVRPCHVGVIDGGVGLLERGRGAHTTLVHWESVLDVARVHALTAGGEGGAVANQRLAGGGQGKQRRFPHHLCLETGTSPVDARETTTTRKKERKKERETYMTMRNNKKGNIYIYMYKQTESRPIGSLLFIFLLRLSLLCLDAAPPTARAEGGRATAAGVNEAAWPLQRHPHQLTLRRRLYNARCVGGFTSALVGSFVSAMALLRRSSSHDSVNCAVPDAKTPSISTSCPSAPFSVTRVRS